MESSMRKFATKNASTAEDRGEGDVAIETTKLTSGADRAPPPLITPRGGGLWRMLRFRPLRGIARHRNRKTPSLMSIGTNSAHADISVGMTKKAKAGTNSDPQADTGASTERYKDSFPALDDE